MIEAIGSFLIQTIFNLYIYVIILRLLLQAARVRFDNPLSQFSIKLTQPMVRPLQKILPEVKYIDLAVIVYILLCEIVKIFLLTLIESAACPRFAGLIILSVGDYLERLKTFYFYAIIIRIMLNWLTALQRSNYFSFIILQLTEPLMYPMRRFIPLLAGFDLSPLVLIILLQFFHMIVITPIIQIGFDLL